MSFRFGVTGTFGHMVAKAAVKVSSIVLTTGFLRAGYVEMQQENGSLPEDGRGIIVNTLVYSGKNIVDAFNFAKAINDQTSSLERAGNKVQVAEIDGNPVAIIAGEHAL